MKRQSRPRSGRLREAVLLGVVLVLPDALAPGSMVGEWVAVLGYLILVVGLPLSLVRLVRYLWAGPEPHPPPRLPAGKQLRVPGLYARLMPSVAAIGLLGFSLSRISPEADEMVTVLLFPVLGLLSFPLLYLALRPGQVRERACLGRELAGILRLGLPASEAVEQLALEARRRFFSRFDALPTVLYYLHCDLVAGAQLSYGMHRQEFFPPFWPALVTMGERSETLPEVLELLAQLERERHARPSLLRPLLTLPVIGLATLFLNTYIMPTFITMAEGSGARVSFALIHIATWLSYLCLVISFGLLLTYMVPGGGRLRGWLQHGFHLFPGIRGVVQWEQQCLIAFAFWAGARQKRPQPEILDLARLAITEPRYGRALKAAQQRMGPDLTAILAARPDLFCADFRWLVQQGVELEDLESTLKMAVEYLRQRRREAEARWSMSLQLALQTLISVIVLLAALGMWQPVLSLIRLFSEGAAL